MFVKNFNILLAGNNYASLNTMGSNIFQVIGIDGNNYSPSFQFYQYNNTGLNSKLFRISNIFLGDSDFPVSYNQINIQGNTISLNNSSISLRNFGIDENGQIELAYILHGTPLNNDIVKEIGLIKKIYLDDTNYQQVMIYREVLEEPIQLEANTPVDLMFNIKVLIK